MKREDMLDCACHSAVAGSKVFVVGSIDAIDLVASDITLDPLDGCPESVKNAAGLLRNALQVFSRKTAGPRDFAFDNVLGHDLSSSA